MNIFSFVQSVKRNIAYCVIDRTHGYSVSWTTELIKNQADFTVTNIYSKDYNVYQSQSEDSVLKHVTELGYEYAVVISTGTEFVNGDSFFKNVEKLTSSEFFIAGHILDRGNAYYELHHQCYIINLTVYSSIGCPRIGQQELGSKHIQRIPTRSKENYHDDYTPLWVKPGLIEGEEFQHKCHGWNILSTAFNNNLNVVVFGDDIRNNKKHFYPECQTEFLKHISWAYQREHYCSTQFVHTETTDTAPTIIKNVRQVLTPASGTVWLDTIHPVEPVTVIMYDYNQTALSYWQNNVPVINNVTYKFVKLDILHQEINLGNILNLEIKDTFINLSNIFAYEGTMFFSSLEYRLAKENILLSHIKEILPTAFVYFTMRAAMGFAHLESTFVASEFNCVSLEELIQPSWHTADWI